MSFNTRIRNFDANLLGGQAIDSDGNSHLADGIHVRVAPDPAMGLPIRPLEVARISLGPGSAWPGLRTDIDWRDMDGRPLTPPFKVTPSKPARGYLARGFRDACCWLRVRHSSGFGPIIPDFPVSPGLVNTGRGLGRFSASRRTPRIGLRPTRFNFQFANLRVSAFTQTEVGYAEVAVRSRPPYEVAATPIEVIEVRGNGTVEGVEWLNTARVFDEVRRRASLPEPDKDRVELWKTLPLPVTDSTRYSGAPANVFDVAKSRATEAAPKRFGLHDDPGVSGPSASPSATSNDELSRLAEITDPEAPDKGLKEHLQDLLDTDKPSDIIQSVPISESGNDTFELSVLDGVLQSLADPGVAHWMGFATVDKEPLSTEEGDLVAYAVGGRWILPNPIEGSEGPADVGTVLCAVIGHPGNRPRPPEIDNVDDRGFLPMPPPDARRAVDISLSGIALGAGLAVARQLPGSVTGLNKRMPSGRAVPFWPVLPETAETPGQAKLTDRFAPPETFNYRSSQHDWFGRWSEWSDRALPAAERPGPPIPVLYASYVMPTDLSATGPLAGTINVRIPVPPVDSLSPGALLLDHIELLVDGVPQDIALANPANPAAELKASIDGPGLPRAGQATVTLIGHWHDQGGNRSAPSEPRVLVLNDPRPAPGVTFSPELKYTSRPDAAGLARYKLGWTHQPGQKYYRVFYSNQKRLQDHLEQKAEGNGATAPRADQALQAIAASATAADTALVFHNIGDLFHRDLFEQLTEELIPAPSGTGGLSFKHAVSGALNELSFYRVVSVTQAQVESPFAESSLLPVKVPNMLRPPRPTLIVQPNAGEGGQFLAELIVEVPHGNIVPVEYRVRRLAGGASDFESMPVIASGALTATPEGRRRATLVDDGSEPFGSALRPWISYQWRVEVRGSNETGNGPTAEWSDPSSLVSHMFIPPTPPAPPQIIDVVHAAPTTSIRFVHPDKLLGALSTGYQLEVYRQLPGERATMLARVLPSESVATGDGSEFVVDDTSDPPPDTAYRVLVRDPIGRTSLATDPVIVPEDTDG